MLILGSMPGARSLERRQYYAHPRNRFWTVMGELLGIDGAAPYEERCRRLTEGRVALWDVLARCHRPGSLDQAIERGSEEANDLAGFLRRRPDLAAIALNGTKAADAFRRLVEPDLLEDGRPAILELPSTSPANTRWSSAGLAQEWRRIEAFRRWDMLHTS